MFSAAVLKVSATFLCPQPQDPLLQSAKSVGFNFFFVPAASCNHKERFHGLVLDGFESRDCEEIR